MADGALVIVAGFAAMLALFAVIVAVRRMKNGGFTGDRTGAFIAGDSSAQQHHGGHHHGGDGGHHGGGFDGGGHGGH